MTAISTSLFAFMIVCVVTVISSTHYPIIQYVNANCGRTIFVKSDVRIQLSSSLFLTGGPQCSVTLKPFAGQSVVATFLTYNMNAAYVNDYGNCPTESIKMTDYYGTSALGYDNYCSSQKPSGQINLKSQGTFGYTTASNQSPYTATVDLLVTEVVFKQGSCPLGYFDCQNTNCVKEDVTCNGYDDCGNNEDEISGCGIVVTLRMGVIVGIIVGVSVFVVVVVVLSLLFRRYRRRVTYVQYR